MSFLTNPRCKFLSAGSAAFTLAIGPLAADLHVATDGINDNAPGRGQSAGDPYLTIDYAADRATAGSTVFIQGGIYRETVTPGVSGSAGNPIVFKPYDNEPVVITGLNRIVENSAGAGSWQVDAGNVYRIQLNSSHGIDFYRKQASQQVFVNGQMMGEARWPNSPTANPIDFNRLNMAAADSGTLAASPTTGTRDATYVDSDLAGFATDAWLGAVLVFNPGYGWYSRSSESVTGNSGSTLNFRFNPFSGSHRAIPSNGDPYMLVGRRVALDAPGEAYFDDSGRDGTQYRLYLYQPDGGSPAASEIELRRRTKGIDVVDRSYLRFENLTVRAANIETTPASTGCVFDGVNIEHGGSVWQEFRFMFPLYLRGSNHQFVNGRVSGSLDDGIRVEGSGHLVRNCVVSDCLRGGINLSDNVPNVHMEQNTVHTMGSGSFGANAAPGKVIYNHGYLNGLFSTDFSIIGTLGPSDGLDSEWAYNWAHDNLAVRDDNGPGFDRNWFGGSAIRLDYGAGNYLIHHNITWNTTQDEGFAIWAIPSDAPNYLDAKVRLYNNTTDKEIGIVETFNSPASAKGFDLRNNLCGEGFFMRSSSSDASGKLYLSDVILRNNLFPNINIPDDPVPPHLANRQGATGWVNPAVPLFGYALQPGSQAIDNGTVIAGITDGFQGAAPDIGALESGVRPFIAGALVRPRDLPGLIVTLQSGGFLVTGLPAGRSLPQTARIKVGSSASSNDFSLDYEFVNHSVTATFTAPSVPGAGQAVQLSLDGSNYLTLPDAISIPGSGDDDPPAGVVRARFADGAGTSFPQQFPGTAGAGWEAAWSATSQVITQVSAASPLQPDSGMKLSVTRSGGSGSGSQEGISRQWSAVTRPTTEFARLTFDLRLDSGAAVFDNAGDSYIVTLNPPPGTAAGGSSTVYLRCFGAAFTNLNGPIAAREWCVFDGDPGVANDYSLDRFVPTGIIASQGETCRFTIDIHAATGAGSTAGKTHGTYDVTITDDTATRTVSGSGFRSAAYSSGGFLTFTAQQNSPTDALAFSVDSIEIGPLELPPAATATALASSANPAIAGSGVTFTATVTSGSGTPGGSVTFFDGASSLGVGTLDGSGVAAFTTATLSTGSHAITAAYGGDTHYTASTSSVVPQSIEPAPTPYEIWLAGNFSAVEREDPAVSGAEADPDADDHANLLEYAFNTDPRAFTASGMPLVTLSNNGLLSLTFQRVRADVTYSVEGTSDLFGWTILATNPGAVGSSVTVEDSPPPNATARLLRLRVTLP